MCGIAGIFRRDGTPVDRRTLLAATRVLAHRGPDGEGTWLEGHVGLGHRRLAIRDLSDAGRQPMWSASGRVVATYNGEIYNYEELARELERERGIVLRSRCDAELIPNGYEAWGDGVFDRLEGMFAVGLWDTKEQRLVLARDGVGIKPLYVADNGRIVRFASEVKSFQADPEFVRVLEPSALHAYLAQGYVAPDRTLLRDVAQLPPGTVRTYDRDGRRERRFWQPERRPDIRRLSDALDAFESLWPQVVTGMLVSDVPVGVLQSGGVDSTLISLVAARGRAVPLFTASFASEAHDEVPLAQIVARTVGARHVVVPVQREESAEATFRAVVRHTDGQIADSSAFAFFVLSREIRKHVPVVLSGDGGDEFFGGYATYRATRLAARMRLLIPASLARGVGRAAMPLSARSSARVSAWEALGRFLLGMTAGEVEAHAEWRRLLQHDDAAALYGPELRGLGVGDPLDAYKQCLRNAEGTLLDRCLLADQRFYLPADMLMKVDSMSMAHGMEVRVPFLDRRVMDLAGRIAARLLDPVRGPHKLLLRRAAQRSGAPRGILRARKRGFNVPIAGMLRGELSPLCDRLLRVEADRLAPFIDPAALRRMWREHAERRANHSYVLWAIMTLAIWQSSLDEPLPRDTRWTHDPPSPGKIASA
jgi:asparagine synthase (glutamine-hydrolysing)